MSVELILQSVCFIQVNSKATMLFSGVVGDEVHENILWPELPYVIDEHGSECLKSF